MDIADILTVERIAIDVDANSKKGVLEELARLAASGPPEELTPAQAFDGLIGRERLGSTGLGNGIAIPHGRIDHLTATRGAFLRSSKPIDFDAIDGEPVDLFFALFVPADTTEEHLAVLSMLAESFSDQRIVDRLRTLDSRESIHALLTEA